MLDGMSRIEIGKGPPLKITALPEDTLHYDIEKRLFARYADYFLMGARLAQANNDPNSAKRILTAGLKLVPYCSFAWEQLCNLLSSEGAESRAACEMAKIKEPYCDPRRP